MAKKIRLGTRGDIDALVDVNCSDVEAWYHYSSKGRGEKASYDELSPWERAMHGGPWMDRGALTSYWDDIEQLGMIPLVAELDGKVVGHLDVIFSDEQPLGHFLFLDVLMVHKAYRRRGVATAMINEAEKLARDGKVGFMLVCPEQYEGPSGLTYRSCGFEKAFDVYDLETTMTHLEVKPEVQIVSIPRNQESPVKTHIMICSGWRSISAKAWYYTLNPNMEDLYRFSRNEIAISVQMRKSTYFIYLQQNLIDPLTGSLNLWAPMPTDEKELQTAFGVCRSLGSWLGIKTLSTRAHERYVSILEKAGFTTKSVVDTFLIKKLSQ